MKNKQLNDIYNAYMGKELLNFSKRGIVRYNMNL